MVRFGALSSLMLLPVGLAWKIALDDEVRHRLEQPELQLISFIAPETDNSKAIETEWEAVVKEISALTVNCTASKSLCQELEVVSFPTIRAYKGLKDVVRYRGPRVSRDIIAFSSRIRRRPVTALDSNTLKDFVGTDNIVVVAQLSSQDESLRELFSDAAKEYYDRYTFGVLNTDSANRGLLCYNNVEGTQHVANDLASVRVVHQLVEACIAPTIPELTRRNEMKYLSGGKSLVYYFSNEATDRAAYTAAMRQTAKAYQEYLTLVTVDSNEYPSMPLSMGIESSTGVAVRNLHNGQVFPHRGKSTPEAIGAFIVSISKGEVAPWDGVLPSQKTVPRDEL